MPAASLLAFGSANPGFSSIPPDGSMDTPTEVLRLKSLVYFCQLAEREGFEPSEKSLVDTDVYAVIINTLHMVTL